MKNFVYEACTLSWTNGTGVAVVSGQPVFIGALIAIAMGDIAIAGTGEVKIGGVVRLTKDAPLAITQGDALFWNTTDKEVTKTATDQYIGRAASAAASADTTVEVLLDIHQGAAAIAVLTDNSGAGAANGTIEAITLTEPANLAAQTVINAQLAAGIKELATKLNALIVALNGAGEIDV
jgi:predicted RecA/RadA family phage recombinase